MIKGINDRPYLDLEPYVDLNSFFKLIPEIYRGFAEARDCAKEGTWMKPAFDFNYMSYIPNWKPMYKAIEEFLALGDDDPIKQGGIDLYRDFNDFRVRNKFTRYVKMAMGAYDPYIYYFLWDQGDWHDRQSARNLTEEAKYFPETVKWIESLVPEVFDHIGRVIFFHRESDGKPFEHRDLDGDLGIQSGYTPHRNEFLFIRQDLKSPFYIWDPETNNKIYINSRIAWWNDQDWHGGDSIKEQSWSLRIDGKFSDQFRKKLGIDHIESY